MTLYQAPVLAAFGLALCLAQPALAQIARTPVGAVNATIDGTPYSGETIDVPSEGTIDGRVPILRAGDLHFHPGTRP